jgi:hypothetical protein
MHILTESKKQVIEEERKCAFVVQNQISTIYNMIDSGICTFADFTLTKQCHGKLVI